MGNAFGECFFGTLMENAFGNAFGECFFGKLIGNAYGECFWGMLFWNAYGECFWGMLLGNGYHETKEPRSWHYSRVLIGFPSAMESSLLL